MNVGCHHKWLGISGGLKCWGAWSTICGYKAKDIAPCTTWTREAWKNRSGRWSFLKLKGRESAIVNQTISGTVSEATLGETSERRYGARAYIYIFFSSPERIVTILNWPMVILSETALCYWLGVKYVFYILYQLWVFCVVSILLVQHLAVAFRGCPRMDS